MFPKENIENLLKSVGLADCIPKLKEKEITEPEVFFELGAEALIGILEIKTEGKKFRFKQKMEEIIKKHEKSQSLKDQEDISEVVENAFNVL